MSFYNKPWAPGYSLPSYLDSEDPLERGSAITTPKLPRGTFGPVPKGLKFGGYALPQYIKDEPIGSHARTTPQLPHGTISATPASVKDSGNPWSESTLESNGLGSLGEASFSDGTLPGGDPIRDYGKQAASIILGDLKKLSPKEHGVMLRKVLNEIDPKLNSLVRSEIGKAKSKGLKDPVAAGLAAAFSRGMLDEFIRLGRTKRVPLKSQVGLGASWGQHDNYVGGSEALGGFTSWVKGVTNKLGSAACKVATNGATPLVAGAAGAYAGGPTGASLAVTGAGVAAAACAPDAPAQSYSPGFGGGAMPGWAMPAIIGGGALALILVLKK